MLLLSMCDTSGSLLRLEELLDKQRQQKLTPGLARSVDTYRSDVPRTSQPECMSAHQIKLQKEYSFNIIAYLIVGSTLILRNVPIATE